MGPLSIVLFDLVPVDLWFNDKDGTETVAQDIWGRWYSLYLREQISPIINVILINLMSIRLILVKYDCRYWSIVFSIGYRSSLMYAGYAGTQISHFLCIKSFLKWQYENLEEYENNVIRLG